MPLWLLLRCIDLHLALRIVITFDFCILRKAYLSRPPGTQVTSRDELLTQEISNSSPLIAELKNNTNSYCVPREPSALENV